MPATLDLYLQPNGTRKYGFTRHKDELSQSAESSVHMTFRTTVLFQQQERAEEGHHVLIYKGVLTEVPHPPHSSPSTADDGGRRVCCKFVKLPLHTDGEYIPDLTLYGRREGIKRLEREAKFYREHLKPAWGVCVPYYYGLWQLETSDYRMVCILLEDCGQALPREKDLSALNDYTRISMMRTLLTIHALSVQHNMWNEADYWLLNEQKDRAFLINFRYASKHSTPKCGADGQEILAWDSPYVHKIPCDELTYFVEQMRIWVFQPILKVWPADKERLKRENPETYSIVRVVYAIFADSAEEAKESREEWDKHWGVKKDYLLGLKKRKIESYFKKPENDQEEELDPEHPGYEKSRDN